MKNNIPQGYKATSLGIIPQEWEIKKLEEVGKLFSGLTYSPSDVQADGILVLRSSNIQKGQLVFEDNVFVNTPSYTPVKENDILICVRNGSRNLIGKTAMITKEVEGCAFGAFMSIFRSPINKYIFYLFGTELYRKYIYRNLGATINSINGNDLKRFRFPFPQIVEQQKIVNILSTWDKSIEKQSQLIEKLELRKKGLMQQLLTAKKRLPGYSDSWKRIKYYNILTETHRSLKWDENELYDLISVRRRSGGVFHRESLYGYEIKTKNLRPALEGDFLISKMQIVHGASGVVPKQLSGMKISGSYIALVAKDPQELNINYFNLWSQMPLFYRQTFISSNGVHIEKMTFDLEIFMSLSMDLPPIEEQNKIVTIISSACKDIELAKQKLELFRQQKHGLMQQLLTGKKRVNINN